MCKTTTSFKCILLVALVSASTSKAQTYDDLVTLSEPKGAYGCTYPSLRNALDFINKNINLQDNKGKTMAYIAAERGHLYTLKNLVKLGADLNIANSRGFSPLHVSIRDKSNDILKFLVEQSVDLNARDSNGRTALFRAANKGNLKACEILLRSGADPNISGNKDWTPADVAASKQYNSILELLTNHTKT